METIQVLGYVELTHHQIEARFEKEQWWAYLVTRNARLKIHDQYGAAMKADKVPDLMAALQKEYPHWHFYPEPRKPPAGSTIPISNQSCPSATR